jgi:hypothetical protein
MKKLFLILIASFALLMAHDSNRIYAGDDDNGGIPLSNLAGKYAQAGQGSATLCFNPNTFPATENCFTAGAIILAFNAVFVGQKTQDNVGNSCLTATQTLGFPGSPEPPSITVFQGVNKVTNYDPATGSGDESFTNYTGGKCNKSKFDSTGATVLNHGTLHFVASHNGERTDSVPTTITDSVGDIGAFNSANFNLKQ